MIVTVAAIVVHVSVFVNRAVGMAMFVLVKRDVKLVSDGKCEPLQVALRFPLESWRLPNSRAPTF